MVSSSCMHVTLTEAKWRETFPIDDARALTGNGRRPRNAQTAVAHLYVEKESSQKDKLVSELELHWHYCSRRAEKNP